MGKEGLEEMGCTYFMEDYFPKREKADDTNVDNALSPHQRVSSPRPCLLRTQLGSRMFEDKCPRQPRSSLNICQKIEITRFQTSLTKSTLKISPINLEFHHLSYFSNKKEFPHFLNHELILV